MKWWNSQNPRAAIAVLTALTCFGLTLGACSYDDAQYHCGHEGGFSGDAQKACETGATLVGPKYGNIKDADADCHERYNVSAVPYSSDVEAWTDRVNAKINEYNGCHWGAAGHLYVNHLQDAETITSSGCVEVADAGGNVSCQGHAPR